MKGVADHIDNTTHFERSVLSSLCTVVFKIAQSFRRQDALLGKTAEMPSSPGLWVADKMEALGFQVVTGDVIFRGDSAGLVVACLSDGTSLAAVVDVLDLRVAIAPHSRRCVRSGRHEAWLAAEICHSLAWYFEPDNSVVVLRM